MATQNTTKRLRDNIIQQDIAALRGIKGFSDYSPIRVEASVEYLQQAQREMQEAQEREIQAKAKYRDAVDAAQELEWKFHNGVLAMKTSVLAQYGDDSTQAESVGYKRKSDYKRPKRKPSDSDDSNAA